MDKPLVSIGVPLFNEETYLQETLESLLAQSYSNTEIIISDNASTDRTQEICRSFAAQNPKITYVRQSQNQGAIANFEKLIKLARGQYFMFAGGHDLWNKDFISRCVYPLEKDSLVSLCYPGAVHIGPDGSVITRIPGSIETRGLDQLSRVMTVLWGVGYGFPVYGLFRTKDIKNIAFGLKIVARDILLLCEVSCFGTIAHVQDPLLYVRKLPDFGDWERYVKKCIGEESSPVAASIYTEMRETFASRLAHLLPSHPILEQVSELIKSTLDLKFSWIKKQVEQAKDTDHIEINRDNTLLIILDAVFFQLSRTGIARLWESLLNIWSQSSFAQHILLLDRMNTAPDIPGIRKRVIRYFDPEKPDSERLYLQRICDKEGADLFVSSYYTTPLSTPSVFLAYDMIPEVSSQNLDYPMWRQKHHAIDHATHYITISDNTAKDLIRFFPQVDSSDITVAHCGVAPLFRPASVEEIYSFTFRYGVRRPYFLCVGARTSYKNIQIFFRAFSTMNHKDEFDIVCIGSTDLENELRDLVQGSTVHLFRLKDEELRLAYCGAMALVYPSLYEGFGLPILEAMACGCPVITSHVSSIPEVAGEAALYIDPRSTNSIQKALIDVQDSALRISLRQKGIQQAMHFSWDKMAKTIRNTLIDLTLKPLGLSTTNLIILPDWEQSEEELHMAFKDLVNKICHLENRAEITVLFVDDCHGSNSSLVNPSWIVKNSLLETILENEELQSASDLPHIARTGQLSKEQWEVLQDHLSYYLPFQFQNTNHPFFSTLFQIPHLHLT